MLDIVVSKTYCVAFLLCLFSSCVPHFASFSGLSIFVWHFDILISLFTIKELIYTCTFWWDVGNMYLILEQHAELTLYNASQLTQSCLLFVFPWKIMNDLPYLYRAPNITQVSMQSTLYRWICQVFYQVSY